MDASVEVAMRLEELFGGDLTQPLDVSEGAESVREIDEGVPEAPEEAEDAETMGVLSRVGFIVHPTARAPFKTVSEDSSDAERLLLTGHSSFNKTAEKRARIMASISRVAETRSVYFVDDADRENVDETVIIRQDEADDIDDPEDLEDLIRDRAAAP
jgi:putative transcriptional regulator